MVGRGVDENLGPGLIFFHLLNIYLLGLFRKLVSHTTAGELGHAAEITDKRTIKKMIVF